MQLLIYFIFAGKKSHHIVNVKHKGKECRSFNRKYEFVNGEQRGCQFLKTEKSSVEISWAGILKIKTIFM